MKLKNIIYLIAILPFAVAAQSGISGRIIDKDKNPVASVSVFLNNTTIGDKTTHDGVFTLNNIKPGKYELTVSIIGFESYSQPVTVNDHDILLPDIEITQKTIALNEVKIKGAEDPNWERNYNWFKREFLGASDRAEDCKILNPAVLDLNYDETTKTLTASSYDYLEIENPDLGYKIKYQLKNFSLNFKAREIHYDGNVLFENMKGTSGQDAHWKKNRQEVYEGSEMQFMRAACSGK